ncbi:MAG TPA: PhzF family phenazine biosynthesis protein [Burkholderiales bacterium]|nr:PhzF family phenazine biosynthesis protein [Burkholderiales bacterium]
MAKYRFHTLDVFTSTRFGGNPLAVVLDADDLPGERMQAIAAEFNLSETVFVMKPARPGANRKRVRIFTPMTELPFAGHPTVGTAFLLARLGLVALDAANPELVLEESVGDVPVKVSMKDGAAVATQMSVPRMPERGPQAASRAELAAALSLAEVDVLDGAAPYSCGLPFLFVPLRGLDAIRRAKLRPDLWEKLAPGGSVRGVFPFTTETESADAQVHGRMFAPALGVREDPATGSAVSALAGWLHDASPRDGNRRWRVEQGFEIGRPSLIELEADVAGGKVTAVRVGGRLGDGCRGRDRGLNSFEAFERLVRKPSLSIPASGPYIHPIDGTAMVAVPTGEGHERPQEKQ